MAANANVELQILARNATARELARTEEDLRGIGAAAREAEASAGGFTSALEPAPGVGDFLARVQDDVRTASADFKAGLISVEDYQVALQHARTEATRVRQGTQLGGKELAVFSNIMDQTTQRTGTATKSTRTLVSSLVSLGAQATGASGALGQVARVALALGSGGIAAGVLAAAVAGVTAGYNLWTKEARENKKAHDDLFASIREGVRATLPESVRWEQQRQQLERMGAALATDRMALEVRLGGERERLRAGDALAIERVTQLEAKLVEAQDQENMRLHQLNGLLWITSNERQKSFERQRDQLILDGQLIGASEEQTLRLKAAADGLTHAEIEQLVVTLRANAADRERNLIREDGIQWTLDAAAAEAKLAQAVADRARAQRGAASSAPGGPTPLAGRAPLLRGADPNRIAPVEVGGGEGSSPAVGIREGWAQADEELAHFGATLEDVIRQGADFESAFVSAFAAMAAGNNVAAAFGKAMLQSLAQAAGAKGSFYAAQAVADLGDGLLGLNPGAFAAAAKHAAAAAMFFALGGLSAAGGTSIGGGPGSGGGASASGSRSSATQTQTQQPPLNVYLRGSLAVLGRDPEFVDTIATAFGEATGRNIINIHLEDGD